MTNKITWAVMTDGRYIRVHFNNGQDNKFYTVKADDNEALAELSYEVVRQVKPNAVDGKASKTKTDMQLLSDFLSGQHNEQQYQALIIAAPKSVIDELKNELPDVIQQLIIGEVTEDIIAKSMDEIDQKLAEYIS